MLKNTPFIENTMFTQDGRQDAEIQFWLDLTPAHQQTFHNPPNSFLILGKHIREVSGLTFLTQLNVFQSPIYMENAGHTAFWNKP